MKRKPHPPSQKDRSFSLGTFGTHATGFKCFDLKVFKQCLII